jgi:hypothetical protein
MWRLFGSCVGAFVLWAVYDNIKYGRRARALRDERSGPGFTRADFIAAFADENIPVEIPTAVYEYFFTEQNPPSFPISPADKFEEDLLVDPEDLDDDFVKILDRLQLIIPPEYILEQHDPYPFVLATLRDFVLALDWIRRHQPGTPGVSTAPVSRIRLRTLT